MTNLSRRQFSNYLAKAWLDKSVSRKALVNQMAAYLISTKSTKQVDLLIADFENALFEQQRVVVARIASAHELSAAIIKEIEAELVSELQARKIVTVNEIDSSLIGGLVIKTPGLERDLSVKAKLNLLKGAKS